MPSLPSDLAVRVANYHMGITDTKSTLWLPFWLRCRRCTSTIQISSTPGRNRLRSPTASAADRNRRVDSITHWCQNGSWDFHVGAVYERKKPDATPKEIEICEGQVYDACERNVRDRQTGRCYGFSGFGSFWRVFVLKWKCHG
jgi:hypothetical protein